MRHDKRYDQVLRTRHDQTVRSQPLPKEEPLSLLDYKNKLALRDWRTKWQRLMVNTRA